MTRCHVKVVLGTVGMIFNSTRRSSAYDIGTIAHFSAKNWRPELMNYKSVTAWAERRPKSETKKRKSKRNIGPKDRTCDRGRPFDSGN